MTRKKRRRGRAAKSISVSGAFYAKLKAYAAIAGKSMRAIAEAQLVPVLDAADADAARWLPIKRRQRPPAQENLK